MGFFGALFLLACGGAHAYKGITESLENEKSREEARKRGQKYYHALDGERAVDTNHKILRLPDGIKDMQTGQWLYDKKKQDAKERKELSELDEIAKKEAIIKGEKTYWCTLHESDPRRFNRGIYNGRYQRLTSNDMPVDRITRSSFSYYYEKHQMHLYRWYEQVHELQYGFLLPMNAEPEIKEKAYKFCKDCNMRSMSSICHAYPINEVEVIYKYCKKYNIPIGTWDEIEIMMLEEHPLGWKKIPACDNWKFNKFMDSFIW